MSLNIFNWLKSDLSKLHRHLWPKLKKHPLGFFCLSVSIILFFIWMNSQALFGNEWFQNYEFVIQVYLTMSILATIISFKFGGSKLMQKPLLSIGGLLIVVALFAAFFFLLYYRCILEGIGTESMTIVVMDAPLLVLASISEEIFFRGTIAGLGGKSVIWKYAFVPIIFMLWHFQASYIVNEMVLSFLFYLVIGMIFQLIVDKVGLLGSISSHTGLNLGLMFCMAGY